MQNAAPASWEVHLRVMRLIRADMYRAARKYRHTNAWWNPELAAYHNKTQKRFAQLERIGHGISKGNSGETSALFIAYADYKECLDDGWDKHSVMKERECHAEKLLKFCTPERIAAGLNL